MGLRAFTLIELLIVVMIISILSVIGVVNLQLAQVRSKVAAGQADMYAVTVALEAYHGDHHRYPEDYAETKLRGDFGLGRLTTPIAYITSIPQDVFGGYIDQESGKRIVTYSLGTEPDEQASRWMLTSAGPNQVDETSPVFGYPGIADITFDQPTERYFYLRYDPTNGTTSAGDLIRVSDAQDVMNR